MKQTTSNKYASWFITDPNSCNEFEKIFYCSECHYTFEHCFEKDDFISSNVKCPMCHNNTFYNSSTLNEEIVYLLQEYWECSIFLPGRYVPYEHQAYQLTLYLYLPSYHQKTKTIFFTPKKFLVSYINSSYEVLDYCYFNSNDNLTKVIKKQVYKKFIKVLVERISKHDQNINLIELIQKSTYLSSKQKLKSIARYVNTNNSSRLLNVLVQKEYKLLNNKYFIVKEEYLNSPIIEYIAYFHQNKAVKRTLFKTLMHYINNNSYYPILGDYIFCRVFQNKDCLYKVLNSLEFKEYIFSNQDYLIDIKTTIKCIKILINIYGEKNIANLICSSKKNTNLLYWQDIFRIAYNDLALIQEKFSKVSCNVKKIHDEFVRVQEFSSEIDYKFNYTEYYLNAEVLYNNLSFKLPKSNYELISWGAELKNCLRAYAYSISSRSSTIYGVFYQNNLLYAVEIDESLCIKQASGFNNSTLPKSEMKIIKTWHKKQFIDKKEIEDYDLYEDELLNYVDYTQELII